MKKKKKIEGNKKGIESKENKWRERKRFKEEAERSDERKQKKVGKKIFQDAEI